jgi:hypothetical protein
MPKVTIVIGMPGSGKSRYFETVDQDKVCIFDDYHGSAIDKSPRFEKSRHYECLKSALASGKDCLIADIDYCYEGRLNEAERGIEKIGNDLKIKIGIDHLYFQKDPNACKENVRRRHREQMEEELRNIDKMNGAYNIPSSAPTWPVWKG